MKYVLKYLSYCNTYDYIYIYLRPMFSQERSSQMASTCHDHMILTVNILIVNDLEPDKKICLNLRS